MTIDPGAKPRRPENPDDPLPTSQPNDPTPAAAAGRELAPATDPPVADRGAPPKIFLLDTSVILYDAEAFNSFEEHDVAVPITVLEELDQFKKGNGVINFQARQFLREIDALMEDTELNSWIPINGSDPGHVRGKLRIVVEQRPQPDAIEVLGSSKNDHRILNAALHLKNRHPERQVVLVSKDISLRVKARGLGLRAEDYETVRIADVEHIRTGSSFVEVDDATIDRLYAGDEPVAEEVLGAKPQANEYFILRGARKSALAYHDPASGELRQVAKQPAYSITPRNAEQTFALHAIRNPDVPLVSITGAAGTGKTLLALAGALAERRSYRQIYLTRPIVPLSNRDVGYLPGDIQSKIGPYMEPLWDNLGFIKNQFSRSDREYRAIEEMIELEKLHIMPLAYIRGRSLSNILFIVDEAQNLTPHEIKTIITRAGEGTKVVFTGDIHQIDTPYLDVHSNGLSYLIDRIHDDPLYAHVQLERGERSELANLASRVL